MEQEFKSATFEWRVHTKLGKEKADDHWSCSSQEGEGEKTAGNLITTAEKQRRGAYQTQTGKKRCLYQVFEKQYTRQVRVGQEEIKRSGGGDQSQGKMEEKKSGEKWERRRQWLGGSWFGGQIREGSSPAKSWKIPKRRRDHSNCNWQAEDKIRFQSRVAGLILRKRMELKIKWLASVFSVVG